MFLVDTSVWILVFRRSAPLDLEQVVEFEQVVTCLPVVQEVLQGFRDDVAFRVARAAMLALPMVESPMERELYEEAVGLYRSARRAGITLRSSVDCLIAACAVRHGLTVLHDDRDYAHLSAVSPLQARSLR
jgi:predicted nucleic acid-binding protein